MELPRRATAARALRLMARRLEFRAGILEGVRMEPYNMAVLELRSFAKGLRSAADALLSKEVERSSGGKEMGGHRVYMKFERSLNVWRISFRASGMRLKDLTFADRNKVWFTAQRAGGLPDLAAKQAMETALRQGMGGVMLMLTDEQIAKLKR